MSVARDEKNEFGVGEAGNPLLWAGILPGGQEMVLEVRQSFN